MKLSKTLVVGAGKWQEPLIDYLITVSEVVDVVDPYDGLRVKTEINKQYQIDIKEKYNILAKIKNLKYDLIISDQSDLGIETATFLSERLRLPSNSLKSLYYFNRKDISKELCQRLEINTPKFIICEDIDNCLEKSKSLEFPIILKPSDSQSSRGISKVDEYSIMQLTNSYNLARENSRNNIVICEEFIDGIEYTIEGICINRKYTSLAISKKKHFRMGIASELFYSTHAHEKIWQRAHNICKRIVENTKLQNGIIHAELIHSTKNNELYLIEIACRGGGNLISSDIVPFVSGVNVYDCLIGSLIGLNNEVKLQINEEKAALLHFFEFESGNVKRIDGVEKARQLNGIHKLELEIQLGDNPTPAKDDRSRHGFAIMFGSSECEVRSTLQKINSLINIIYE